MQIDSIPLTHNQIVNKRALPKLELSVSSEIKKPENKVQEKIYDIISSIVRNKNFGVDDDILMTGLNSISMVRLNVLLGKEFDVPMKYMPMADVIYAMNKIGAGIRIEKTLSALMKLEYFDGTFEKRNK